MPNAQFIRSRLEKKGTLYGFYFFKDGKVYEVEVSVGTNTVVKNESQDVAVVGQKDTPKVSLDVINLIKPQKNAKTKLPDGRLLEIALDALKDAGVSEVTYFVSDGKLYLRVGGVVLDAATGKQVMDPTK
ncbi:MAG: hypothetical protein ACKODX_06280 [Gemmata sp.]